MCKWKVERKDRMAEGFDFKPEMQVGGGGKPMIFAVSQQECPGSESYETVLTLTR